MRSNSWQWMTIEPILMLFTSKIIAVVDSDYAQKPCLFLLSVWAVCSIAAQDDHVLGGVGFRGRAFWGKRGRWPFLLADEKSRPHNPNRHAELDVILRVSWIWTRNRVEIHTLLYGRISRPLAERLRLLSNSRVHREQN